MRDLTEQQLGIVKLISEGLENKEIATKLDLEPTTVNQYVARIFDRLGVNKRVQAAVWYTENYGKKKVVGV